MTSNKATAHFAGAIYLALVISGVVALMYVPSKLIVPGDAAATAGKIVAEEALYRLGILAAMLCQLCYIALPLVLYKLLAPVHRPLAILMVTLAFVSVPISFVSIANSLDILALVNDVRGTTAPVPLEVATQVSVKLTTAASQSLMAELFWGLWLLPFGLLVYRSGILPRVLGAFLMIGSVGYLLAVVLQIMWPAWYRASGVSAYINLPSSVGEIGICLWMLIRGAKEQRCA